MQARHPASDDHGSGLEEVVVHQLLAQSTGPDEILDHITAVASAVTGTPFAAIHLLDDRFQHRVAARAAPLESTPRSDSMCRIAVDDETFVETLDASRDARFAYSSFTDGPDAVGYYAAAPLRAGSETVGTLCVWDTEARPVAQPVEVVLDRLSKIAASHLEQRHTVRFLAGHAYVDPLTGLANRRQLHEVLSAALADHRRHGTEVSVVYLDLDRFKPVNDRHGHAVGDEVLREVARRLEHVTRSEETPGRLGGDEFLIVVRGALGAAMVAAERAVQAIGEPITTSAGRLEIGASAGAVTTASPHDTVHALLLRADAAMYRAKSATAGNRTT